ncbi:MAG TPA: DUF418 domain-containing protein [Kofleriaceae bacterium]|nr:DUF418 domain-containing protein [Kofleriaceae bacterium]
MTALAPVAPRERLASLDVLRGFALCGVLIGNMVLYSGRWALHGEPHGGTLDEIAEWFVGIVVDSKAQTLLTFLFGFGFAIQLLRADARGEPVLPVYLRRLLALLVLGWLHVLVLWWGDVTWTYAVSGFGLLAFVHASNRTRVVLGLALTFVPFLVATIPEVQEASLRVFMEPREWGAHTQHYLEVMRQPSRSGLAWESATYALVWCSQIYVWYFLWTLGRFLLGYVAGARRWFERDGAEHLGVFRRFALWGGLIAVVLIAVRVLARLGILRFDTLGVAGRLLGGTLYQITLLAQTIAYVGIVVLLMQRPLWRRVLGVLAPAGRMPLTTYFSQSLAATFVFYGWGLGWVGEVGPAGCLGLALAIFSVQVAIAHVWLRFFRFGPLEWVWRAAVYWKLPAMRSRASIDVTNR